MLQAVRKTLKPVRNNKERAVICGPYPAKPFLSSAPAVTFISTKAGERDSQSLLHTGGVSGDPEVL